MLKKLILSAMLGLAFSTYATPVYLTFEGDIAASGSSPTITAPNLGTATIVIMADLSAPGYYSYGGTSVELSPDYYGTYFQTDYVSSPTFSGGTGGSGGVIYNYGRGINYFNPYYNHTYQGYDIYVSPADQSGAWNYVEIYSDTYNNGYTSFAVGQTYYGEGYAEDNTNQVAAWVGNFTLTDISDTNPAAVPEPGTLALFGFGLIGLAGAARWRKIRQA